MKQSHLFPKISAETFSSPNNRDEFYLFNTSTNKGFSIDGFAAVLCRHFNGEKNLVDAIRSFEILSKLEVGEFDDEIENLIQDLQDNSLLVFLDEAQIPAED